MKLERKSVWLACGGIVVATGAALAGSGVGGFFNLGQVNSVSGRTELQGTTATQQLLVRNNSTSGTSTSIYGAANAGTGVWGQSGRVGMRAVATATSGVNYGLFSTTASPFGYAGFFRNTAKPFDNFEGAGIRALGVGATAAAFSDVKFSGGGEFAGPSGVIGVPTSEGGAGVAGFSGTVGSAAISGTTSTEDAVAGLFVHTTELANKSGAAVRALSAGATSAAIPGYYFSGAGEFAGTNGVIGAAAFSGGYGVLAIQGPGFRALQADGDVGITRNLYVTGTVSKASGSFKIDHPLDPANKYLSHSFVESPDMMNIYNGNAVTDARGEATIELPSYYEALNRDPRYQLTVIGSPATAYVSREVSGNSFAIRSSEPGVKVSWQITGIRQDAYALQHPIVVEEDKALADRGRYLTPEAHGQPAELAIGAGARGDQHAAMQGQRAPARN